MGAISAIYVLDSKGKQLIARDFRGDIAASCVERFVSLVTGARQRAKPTLCDSYALLRGRRGDGGRG